MFMWWLLLSWVVCCVFILFGWVLNSVCRVVIVRVSFIIGVIICRLVIVVICVK